MRWVLAAAALIALVALTAAAWLLYTDSGLRWAAAQAQGALQGRLRFEGLRGALARRIQADSIYYEDKGVRVALRDARLRIALSALLGGRGAIRRLQAESLDVTLTAADVSPRERPRPELPLGLSVQRADVERITLEHGEQRHVLEGFALRHAVVLQTGAISASAAFALRHDQYPVAAQLTLGGTLDRLLVAFEGRVADVPASVRAVVVPLAARPLEAIEARAGPLDLRALNAGWPRTALDVKLSGRASAAHALSGMLSARNAAPGPLDQQRLPLAVLETRFASPDFGSVSLQDLTAALTGRGTLSGTATLRPHHAAFDVRVADLDLRAFSSSLPSTQLGITAHIVRDGARVEVRSLRAEAHGGARLTARGALGDAGDELAWTLKVPRIDEFLAGVEGRAQANGTLSGSLAAPRATLVAITTALRLRDAIALESASVRASGSLDRHTVDFSTRAEGLRLHARLRGGWNKPTGWSGELQALRNSGPYSMQLRLPVPLRVAPERVEIGRLDATLADGSLHMAQLVWSRDRLRSSGEFTGLPAQWLIVASGLANRVQSTLLLDGQWNIASTPRLAGSASFRRSSGDLKLAGGGELALGLENVAVDARFKDGHIHASAEIASRYATAAAKADIAPEPGAAGLGITPQSALRLDARIGAVELRAVAQPMLTDARIEGRISARLQARGTLARPVISGSVRGDAIGFAMPPLGVFLRNGQLRAAMEGDSLHVTELAIEGGEGRFTASGSVPLRLAAGGARLAWRAHKFGLLARPDLRLVASGSGEARLIGKRISLSGALRADHGHLELAQQRLPQLGEDVVIVGREREAARARTTRLPVALDLHLDLGDELQVRGYGLEGRLAGDLKLRTTPDGELNVYGHIRTVNATFLAFGQRLYVDPGVATFDGPLDNPSLRATAWRRNEAVEVGVQVSGTARAPQVQLVSQPPLPQIEQLSWLTLGRASTDISRADIGLLAVAASGVLARGDQVPLNRRIANALGLDEVGLRGSGALGERVVALGRRISNRLFITFEKGLGAAASSMVLLEFSLTQRLSVRAVAGSSSGAGLHYRFSWD